MIYVLKSAGYNSDGNFINLIKIGFSDNWEKREGAYRLHNPTIKILFKIDGGNELDEANLHNYFNNYKFPDYGNEWFIYEDEIIEFFQSHTSIDTIRSAIFDTVKGKKSISFSYIKKISEIIFSIIHPEEINVRDIIKDISSYNFRNIESILFYVRTKYEKHADAIIDSIVSWYDRSCHLNDEDKLLLEMFFKERESYSKLKYLCELDDASRQKIIDLVPQYYKNFIETLGLERCKSLGYNYSRVKRDCQIKSFDLNNVSNSVYSNFKIGDKITKAEIKKRLAKIYNELGYQKTAKANDIEGWFETKRARISVNGKIAEGYELIKKKKYNSLGGS